jgi:hypothetical protein
MRIYSNIQYTKLFSAKYSSGYIFLLQKVAAKKNESLQIIDMFNLFTLNSLVKEVVVGIRPSTTTTFVDSHPPQPPYQDEQHNFGDI